MATLGYIIPYYDIIPGQARPGQDRTGQVILIAVIAIIYHSY